MGLPGPVEERHREDEGRDAGEVDEAAYYDAYRDDPEVHAVFYVASFYVFVDLQQTCPGLLRG